MLISVRTTIIAKNMQSKAPTLAISLLAYILSVFIGRNNVTVCSSFVLVTNTTDHTGKTVFALNRYLINYLKTKFMFDTVHFFSDGAACQFRNKTVFAFLAQIDPSVNLNWIFF